MLEQIGHIHPEQLQPNSKKFKRNLGGRKKCDDYTNTLKELAEMLPIPLRTNCKRLAKKEILLQVLRYIEHLQASIDTVRSQLHIRSEERKEEAEKLVVVTPSLKRGPRESTPRTKKPKPVVVCKKPRKKRCTRKSERQTVKKKACKCLTLKTEDAPCQAGRYKTENDLTAVGKVNTLVSSSRRQSQLPHSIHVPVQPSYQPASTTSLDVTKNGVHFHITDRNLGTNEEEGKGGNMLSVYAAKVALNELCQYAEETTRHSPIGQELVYYNSSCEEDESLKGNPWLVTQSPIDISLAGSIKMSSPRIGAQNNSYPDLGLSPSLFSSPGRLLTRHDLQGVEEEFSSVLFEDLYLSPQSGSFAHTLSGTLLRKEVLNIKSERPMSSSDETSDATWTPCKRAKPSQVACQKRKKGVRSQRPRPVVCDKRSSSSLQLKKKCVNGFIMFCRLNRKHFIRTHPGMASTAATRELARLWRMMTKQERKPYCLKARRFSRMNNRIIREDVSSGEEDLEPPKPFHLLLAEKSFPGTQAFGDYSLFDVIS